MKFKQVEDILEPDAARRLGRNASKLFVSVFNQMSLRSSWEVRIVNKVAADRAKVSVHGLRDFHRRLVELGLLEIDPDTRPGFVFAAQCTTYRWPVHKRLQTTS